MDAVKRYQPNLGRLNECSPQITNFQFSNPKFADNPSKIRQSRIEEAVDQNSKAEKYKAIKHAVTEIRGFSKQKS